MSGITFEGFGHRLSRPEAIASEGLFRLGNKLVLSNLANRTYQEYISEGKIGGKVSIKRPYRIKENKGRQLKENHLIDRVFEISIDREKDRRHIAFSVVDVESKFELMNYFDRYVDAGIEEMAHGFDRRAGKALAEEIFFHVGAIGEEMSIRRTSEIEAFMEEVAIPMDMNTYGVLRPHDIIPLSAELRGLDAPRMVSDAVRKAWRGVMSGLNIIKSVHVPHQRIAQEASANAAPLVKTALNNATTEIVIDGFGTGTQNTLVMRKGQLFTIAGVNAVNPRGDREDIGVLQTFRCTEDVYTTDAAGNEATVKVEPEINAGAPSTIANPRQVDRDGDAQLTIDYQDYQTVSAWPAADAVVTILGVDTSDPAARAEETRYRQSIWGCMDGLEIINVTIPTPDEHTGSAHFRDNETGLSMTYATQYDIKNSTQTDRIDVLYTAAVTYPEIMVRSWTEKV